MFKLIINLKTYKESFNEQAINIANICKELESIAKQKNVEIILCPQYLDLKDVAKTGITTYSQHLDDFDFGAHTGYIIPDAIKAIGCSGTIINHSEHSLIYKIKDIEKRVIKARQAGLQVCICARDASVAKKVAKFNPDFIAVEPKELIGGDISISTAKPQLISKSVKAVGDIPLLVGAGVKNSEDIRKSIELGAKGILVASGVIKVPDIKGAILDLLEGF